MTANEKEQTTLAEAGVASNLPPTAACGDECSGELGAGNRALRHAFAETPRQSDQIVELAQAIRLLAFHMEDCMTQANLHYREGLRGIRDSMQTLIFTIKGMR